VRSFGIFVLLSGLLLAMFLSRLIPSTKHLTRLLEPFEIVFRLLSFENRTILRYPLLG
jgi:hypothetical protein